MFVRNSSSANVYSFIRAKGEDTMLVVINFGSAVEKLKLELPVTPIRSWKDLITGTNILITNGLVEMQISPLGFVVLSPLSD